MFDLPPFADALMRGGVLSLLSLLWIIILVNVAGLRSFSKMTSFDFVTTVAFGSLLATASTLTKWTDFAQALCAIAMLFLLQYLVARFRKQSDSFENFIGNDPIMLMRDGEIFQDALEHTRVSRSDLIAKLREANVMHLSEVRAVVLESTGDISVLHGETLDDDLIDGVRTVH